LHYASGAKFGWNEAHACNYIVFSPGFCSVGLCAADDGRAAGSAIAPTYIGKRANPSRAGLSVGAQSPVEQPPSRSGPNIDVHKGEPLPSIFVAVFRDFLQLF
jgi:hypothetical protein